MTEWIGYTGEVSSFADAVGTGEANAYQIFTGEGFLSRDDVCTGVLVFFVMVVGCKTRALFDVDLKPRT